MVISFLKYIFLSLIAFNIVITGSFTNECSAQQKTPNLVKVAKVAAVINGDTIEIEVGLKLL